MFIARAFSSLRYFHIARVEKLYFCEVVSLLNILGVTPSAVGIYFKKVFVHFFLHQWMPMCVPNIFELVLIRLRLFFYSKQFSVNFFKDNVRIVGKVEYFEGKCLSFFFSYMKELNILFSRSCIQSFGNINSPFKHYAEHIESW